MHRKTEEEEIKGILGIRGRFMNCVQGQEVCFGLSHVLSFYFHSNLVNQNLLSFLDGEMKAKMMLCHSSVHIFNKQHISQSLTQNIVFYSMIPMLSPIVPKTVPSAEIQHFVSSII